MFQRAVATCLKVGLVGGAGFAVDASVVGAAASRYQRVAGGKVDWRDGQQAQRPARACLAALERENAPRHPGQAPKAMSPSDPAAAWTTRRRQALSMPALVAVRFNVAMKAKYQALLAAGKPPEVALAAVMRKPIILANALIRDGRTWTPHPA